MVQPGNPEMGQAQFFSIMTPKSAVGDRVPKKHRKVLPAEEKTSWRMCTWVAFWGKGRSGCEGEHPRLRKQHTPREVGKLEHAGLV